MRRKNITGQKFGRWTAIEYIGKRQWKCKCDCGIVKNVNTSNLTGGKSTSCGCDRKTTSTHGMTGTPEYRAWSKAKGRCYSKTDKRYVHYGKRGIKMCDAWLNSFEQFYLDMGHRPDGHTLERIDVNGDYEPDNCKWADWQEQQNNRRNNIRIRIGFKTKTIAEWCRIYNIDPRTVNSRVKQQGMSYEDAITTPVGGR